MPISNQFAQRLLPILHDIIDCYGTPFHIYDAKGIIETHHAMTRAFNGEAFRQYFAVKALPNPHILTLLLEQGSGLDCSSHTELILASNAGAIAEDIVFTSNNTHLLEYYYALNNKALITFDDQSFFDKIDVLPQIVTFRASLQGLLTGSIQMGDAAHSKFGVPRDRLLSAYQAAQYRGVSSFGIHGMICANELNINRAIESATHLFTIAAHLSEKTNIHWQYINLGGGLGIPYHPSDQALDFNSYAEAIIHARRRYFPRQCPRILMECGRYVTGPHGVLISRVINRFRKGRDIIGLDASMSALMRPALYNAYHHISLPFAQKRAQGRFNVVGSLCENFDKFAVERVLPDAQENDIVIIHDTGAHGHAMGFTYNGRLRPAELLLTPDNDVIEIRHAEKIEDYLQTIPQQPQSIFNAKVSV